MKETAPGVKTELGKMQNPKKAKILQRFFKTGKGEYGEGDVFLGINVPQTRAVAKKFSGIARLDLEKLIESKVHEERLCGFLILVNKFQKGDGQEKKNIFDFYIAHAQSANNWDLVDLSADKICGAFLFGKDASLLYSLAKSENIWERRIAMVSTFAFIKKREFKHTFRISELLMGDSHDLIHKAAGWMLREAGKRGGEKELTEFLEKHASKMPRTMLRYAVERMPPKQRVRFLSKKRNPASKEKG
ncbi:MAG TPA: DNA alkylation repair protein [archaeon]|nr:DNA alkylation repair protein [archaeon]